MKSNSKPLPEYPSTIHLPWKPNTKGDRIASQEEASIIFQKDSLVEEKVDGANCGMALIDGHPLIRSRTKILRKGDLSKDLNPSMAQFASAFTWFYKNQDKFDNLEKLYGQVSVYGEWMVQQHGMEYNELPDWFVAFDLYDQVAGQYIKDARDILIDAGFDVAPLLWRGKVESYEQLEEFANGVSSFTKAQREGLYIKVSDDKWTTHRFKMVRQGFSQGALLGDSIKRNSIGKS